MHLVAYNLIRQVLAAVAKVSVSAWCATVLQANSAQIVGYRPP
jgi:hypothetical protein